jgi:hypothetical protein
MYIFEFQTAKYAAHLRSRQWRVKQSIPAAQFAHRAEGASAYYYRAPTGGTERTTPDRALEQYFLSGARSGVVRSGGSAETLIGLVLRGCVFLLE